MSDDEEEDVIRWPDEGSAFTEPEEEEVEDKELEVAQAEEDDKQRATRKLLEALFDGGASPFAAEAPASPAAAARGQRRLSDAAVAPAGRPAAQRTLPPELQAASLGLTVQGRTITCDTSAPLGEPVKPVCLTPPLTGAGEIQFRIGERWLGQNEFFCVGDQQHDAVRGGVQRCPKHSAWGYISSPGAFSGAHPVPSATAAVWPSFL